MTDEEMLAAKELPNEVRAERLKAITEWATDDELFDVLAERLAEKNTVLSAIGLSGERMPEKRFRAWWISPVPSEAFFYETTTKAEAQQVLDALAEFDLHRVRTGKAGDELCNAGGIEQWDSEGEWEDCDE